MQEDLITVIVPVYNVEDYFARCIESICNQTYTALEIILVDDGSTDLSGVLCDRYSARDSRIVVIHKKNGGLSDARNVGIDKARGRYICFVDSDDWLDEDMIELLHNMSLREDADIVECSYRNIYDNRIEEETSCSGEVIIADNVYAMRCQLRWRYFKSVVWNKLYRKNLFTGDNRFPEGKCNEDEYLIYKLFYMSKKLVYVDVSKYNYTRCRVDSITGKVSSRILDRCYAFRERIEFVEEHGLDELKDDIRNVYCYVLFEQMFLCYKDNIVDDKVVRLIDDVIKERSIVMGWNIIEEYKNIYESLCKAQENFMEEYSKSKLFEGDPR